MSHITNFENVSEYEYTLFLHKLFCFFLKDKRFYNDLFRPSVHVNECFSPLIHERMGGIAWGVVVWGGGFNGGGMGYV